MVGPLAWLRNALLAALGFAAVGAALRPLVPWPEEFGLRDKLAHLAAHADDYDGVVLGSSYTYRAFVPAVVDAELQKRGRSMLAFNLALPGMSAYEANHLLEEALALAPGLRRAIVQAPLWEGGTEWARNAASPRSVAWHTTRQTRLAVGHLVGQGGVAPGARLRLVGLHLRAWTWRACLYGQGPAIVAALAGPPPAPVAEHGFAPLDPEADEVSAARHARFLEEADEFRRRVDELPRLNALPFDPAGYNLAALDEQVTFARARGVEPVYLLPPFDQGASFAFALAAAGRMPNLMAFNRPDVYPELYEIGLRFDAGHLNRAGAEAFSRAFAERLGAP